MKVQFYSKLPLSRNMQVRFASKSAQNNFFESNHVISHDNVSVQIVDKNNMKIDGLVSNYQPINYMRFTSEDKWYYAYVTAIEYVNNNVTLIRYEIDVIQTFLFDVEFLQSYIVRQHPYKDEIGANLMSEPQIAPLIYEEIFAVSPENATSNRAYLLLAKAGPEVALPSVNTYYIGTVPFIGYAKKCANISELQTEINAFTSLEVAGFSLGTSDRIIAIYDVPDSMCKVGSSADYYSVSSLIDKPDSLDGYSPKNKKLLQYPFIKVTATNNRGNKNDFAYEAFDNGLASFNLFADVGINDSLILVPANYLGAYNDFNLAVTNTNRLDVPFQQNNFTWSQLLNVMQSASNATISSGVQAAQSISSGNVMGEANGVVSEGGLSITGLSAITSAISEIGNSIVFGYPQNSGVVNSDLLTALGASPFKISAMTVRKEIAKAYDDYFTRFGYAQNKIDDVNIYQHDKYCYIQTRELQISGEIQADYMNEFKLLFNSGITFFDSMSEVGNYE